MDHLFYIELGNSTASGIFNSGPFMNIQHGPALGENDEYWYATVLSDIPTQAWFFSFLSGRNDPTPQSDDFVYAWAVHDGDVAAVPEPNTLLLLASGLIGMVAFRKKFKK